MGYIAIMIASLSVSTFAALLLGVHLFRRGWNQAMKKRDEEEGEE